jgi:hypothetical protein
MRQDQEQRQAAAELRKLVDAAEASGVSARTVPEIMAAVENRLREEGRLPAGEQL